MNIEGLNEDMPDSEVYSYIQVVYDIVKDKCTKEKNNNKLLI